MNIVNKIGEGTVIFDHVPSGEIILYENKYFLVIDCLENNYGNRINAIDLSDGGGEGAYFYENDKVLLVKATLTIESR